MTEESAGAPKYGRGENPRSLSNLHAPWTSETRPDPAPRGPLVTPALKRFLAMPMAELRELVDRAKGGDVPDDLTVAEAMALVMLKKSLDTKYGDKTREQVINRADGETTKAAVEVEVGVKVKLTWGDQ